MAKTSRYDWSFRLAWTTTSAKEISSLIRVSNIRNCAAASRRIVSMVCRPSQGRLRPTKPVSLKTFSFICNRSHFFHRPVIKGIRDRWDLIRKGEWQTPPKFAKPDHSDYNSDDWGAAHITKTDCLNAFKTLYDIRNRKFREKSSDPTRAVPEQSPEVTDLH